MNKTEKSSFWKAFYMTFFYFAILLGVATCVVGCRGPVEFYPIQDSWVNPFSDKPLPIEDVCGACGVDHELLVAGKDLNECS